jgi:hypothetical protein
MWLSVVLIEAIAIMFLRMQVSVSFGAFCSSSANWWCEGEGLPLLDLKAFYIYATSELDIVRPLLKMI